jgi:hypothetical protein
MKKIFNWAIISTIAFGIVLIAYSILNFICDEKIASLFSALLGVISTIAFGVWVSYIFQRMNDISTKKKNDELIETIREREFSKLRFHLSSMVRDFHMREDQIVLKFKDMDLKCSFTQDNIDVENLTVNYFVFMSIYRDIDKFIDNEKDKDFVKKNIECLFMKDSLSIIYINEVAADISETYREFHDFNLVCMELSKKMPQLNLDYKLQVFTPNEIAAINAFSNEIGIGYFTNFNPPYEIIQLFTKLLAIQSFIKADFIPYYKKDNFWTDMQERDETEKEFDIMVDDWKAKYKEKAAEKLKTNISTLV